MVQNLLCNIVRQTLFVILDDLLRNVAIRHPDGLFAIVKLDQVLLEASTRPLLVNGIPAIQHCFR